MKITLRKGIRRNDLTVTMDTSPLSPTVGISSQVVKPYLLVSDIACLPFNMDGKEICTPNRTSLG